MEHSNHLSSKMKSSFLMTLIFSYVEHYDKVIRLIRILSKAGSKFIDNNSSQLDYFCAKHISKGLKIQLSLSHSLLLMKKPGKVIFPDQKIAFDLKEPPSDWKSLQTMIRFFQIKRELEVPRLVEATNDILQSAEYFKCLLRFGYSIRYIDKIQRVLMKIDKLYLIFYKRSFQSVLNILDNHQSLKKLKLWFTRECFLIELFRRTSFANLSNLIELKIIKQIENIQSVQQMFRKEHMKTFRNLKILELHFADCLDCHELHIEMHTYFKQMQSLEQLKFSISTFDFTLIESLSNLKVLKVKTNGFVISNNNLLSISKLHSLSLNYKEQSVESLNVLFDSLQNARSICLLKSPGLLFQCFAGNTHLLNLELRINYIEDQGTLEVINRISQLQQCKLYLAINQLDPCRTKKEVFVPFYSLDIQAHSSLRKLKLIFNIAKHINGIDKLLFEENLVAFISSFKQLRSLKVFNSRQKIENILNKIFPQLPILEDLKIESYKTPSKIDQLSYILTEKADCLKSFDILSRDTNQRGFERIIQILQFNKSLHTLKISVKSENLDHLALSNFFKSVKEHPKLRKLSLKLKCHIYILVSLQFIKDIIENCNALKELSLEILGIFKYNLAPHQMIADAQLRRKLIETLPTALPNLDVLII